MGLFGEVIYGYLLFIQVAGSDRKTLKLSRESHREGSFQHCSIILFNNGPFHLLEALRVGMSVDHRL